jgi:hypothetical protein
VYGNLRPVHLAYQPPASSTFSQNEPTISNQPAVLFSQNKSAPAISHQPNEQVVGFWGAFTRLPTSTTTTTTTSPNSLQRLRCYDDDMADPSSSSNAAAEYLSVSLLFIYLFFFLPILQYACLDVLQSSFKYACLECVTFKLSICVYIIIMLNNF